MARIPYFDLSTADEEDRNFFSHMPKLNIFRMLGHAGVVGREFVKLGAAVLRKGKLDPALREIAIIRTGILSGAKYEVHQHTAIARTLGMSEEKISAINEGPLSPVFSHAEKLVVSFTDEIVNGVKAPDGLFSEVHGILGSDRLAELILVVGYYMTVSRFLENFEVDIE